MPTPTYTPLANLTLSSTASSVTFSSISQAYRDLVLVVTGKRNSSGSGPASLVITVNGDTGSNYANVLIYESPGSVAASSQSSLNYMGGVAEDDFGLNVIHFLDYSVTNKDKNVLGRWGSYGSNSQTRAAAGRWANTAAITSITMTPSMGFTSASTFALYGIASA